MFKTFTLFIFASLSVLAGPQDILKQANETFESANKMALQDQLKAEALYKKAILQYEFLIEKEGINNGQLHNNLANAYFLVDDLGRAILHYQKALHLNASDSDIRHNLEYTRAKIIDELPQATSSTIVDFIFFWHNWDFSTRCGLFALVHGFFWISCGLLLYHSCKQVKMARVISLVLSIAIFLSLLTTYLQWDSKVEGVIVAEEAEARQGNSHIYQAAFNTPLHSGTEFKLVEKRDGWLLIELLNGKRCWVMSKDGELVGG